MTNVEKCKIAGILSSVRKRLGADVSSDTSFDDKINAMSNEQLISEYCAWHLGDPSWWRDFIIKFNELNQLDMESDNV